MHLENQPLRVSAVQTDEQAVRQEQGGNHRPGAQQWAKLKGTTVQAGPSPQGDLYSPSAS